MAATKFEELEVWQIAFALSRKVYASSRNEQFAKDFGLRDQARRAAVSCMANIAEGFTRQSRREFIRFLDIARSSAAELQSHLYMARAEEYVSETEFDEIYTECQRLRYGLTSLIRHLKTTEAPK